MKRLILVVLLTILYINGYAQQNQIDSLKKVLINSVSDSNSIDLLTIISAKYVFIKPDSAIFYSIKAASLAQQIGDKRRQATALNQLGGGYMNKGNLVKALQHLKESLLITQQIGIKQMIMNDLILIGLIYRNIENHRQSLRYYFQAVDIQKQIEIDQIYPITLSNIGRAYNYLGQYDSSAYFLEKSLSIFQKSFPKYQSIALINLGDVKFKTKQYALAKDYLLKGSEIAKTIYPRDLAVSYRLLAEIYLMENELIIAEDYAKQAIEIAQNGNFKLMMYQAYRVYADILEAKKDMTNALKYKNLFILYRDSVYSEAAQNGFQIFEYEKEQGQVAILQKEKVLEIASKQEQQNIFLIIVVFFIVISIILGYIIWQKQQSNQMLAKQKAEILLQKEVVEKQSNTLGEMNKEKDKIFSIVAHDLRSPLASLKSVFELVVAGYFSQKEFFDILPKLNRQLDNAFELTEELLYWARSQMNAIKIEPVPTNIEDIFREQLIRCEEAAKAKGILLSSEIAEDLSKAYIDVDMLKNVLRNLIANAVKFCKQGNMITLKAKNEENFVKITVADTGIGIAPENIHKLFAHTNFTTQGTGGEKGTGLGLVLCKDFLEKNGGKIWVESELGKGSNFFLTIPQAA